ncbi:clustered mitochondria protein [Spatholobus suberectus]|nr:clustered mitochondria protein [Spatholobus suberectus]
MAAAPTAKVRLMCSYGGHILPRPRTNCLFYGGGDTRIVSVERRTLGTLSPFLSHLSSVLSLKYPFTLKYQLPHLELDSLISLASDEDLHILIEEHDRAAPSSRIRLFVFPAPLIRHPKTESWFFDALKSSSIMQQNADSMLLDTTSSFGSTSSSSASFTPVPPPHDDHHFTSSHSIPSDNTVSSIMSHQQNMCYQDPVVHVSEARLNAESVEVESKIPYISSGVVANSANVDIGYSSFPQFNQVERPNFQFVQTATHFVPLHTYHNPRPLQHLVYHPNQLCPVYLVPLGNMPPNTLPVTAAAQASMNLNASSINSHVAHNSTSHTQNYLTDNETSSFVHVPYNGNQEQEMDIYPMHHLSQSQNISVSSTESPKCGNELDDDLAHVQIYKSQPPPPALPSKYQTMTKASTNLLSKALAQLHVDKLMPQTETSQPQ